MEFVAIDFETACNDAESACQVGIAVIEDGTLVHEESWLIKPPSSYFSRRNIAIHGIRPKDVQSAPNMAGLWPELPKVIEGRTLIAHNAQFDMRVLAASLAAFHIPCPPIAFHCTRLLARRAWPGKRRYGLKPLAEWLGIRFQHHDALEDAKCCAQIALAAAESCGANSLAQMEDKLGLTQGKLQSESIRGPRSKGAPVVRSQSGFAARTSDRWGFPDRRNASGVFVASSIRQASGGTKPLHTKSVCMLGPLGGFTMEETQALIEELGGRFTNTIDGHTDYVVACGITLTEAQSRIDTVVRQDATNSDLLGFKVLSERQFRALLPGGKAQSG